MESQEGLASHTQPCCGGSKVFMSTEKSLGRVGRHKFKIMATSGDRRLNCGTLQRPLTMKSFISFLKINLGIGTVAQLVECLPGVCRALGLIPSITQTLGIVVHTCSPSTHKVEAGESETQLILSRCLKLV